MEIYKKITHDEFGIEEIYEYTTDDLIMDEPCYIKTIGNIYPIKVKEWLKFQKYIPYLVNSKKHLKLKDTDSLLDSLIWLGAVSKNKGNLLDFENDGWIIYFNKAMQEFEELFSMLTKKTIRRFELGGRFLFTDDKGECMINDTNFEELRQVVMKMCLLREMKIFDDKLYEQMYYKALRANRKEGISFDDILLTVVQDMKYSFDYIYNINVFQLYSLYHRVAHVKNSDAITIYRTCSEKLPNINYTDGVINNLYKEKDDSDLFVDLDGIAGKLK